MRLEDVKDKIDSFFDNISAKKLYEISVLKYGFSEISYDVEGFVFETTKVSYYSSNDNSLYSSNDDNSYDLPIAA